MSTTRSKFSTRMAGHRVAVDVLALSPQARANSHWIPLTSLLPVVNGTTKLFRVPVMYDQVVQAIALTYTTVPVMASGTATIQVDYTAVDGTTVTNIVAATSILLLTANVPLVLTLAATNPVKCAAGGSLLVTVVTSANTVGTADVGGGLSIYSEAVEAATIADTNTTI